MKRSDDPQLTMILSRFDEAWAKGSAGGAVPEISDFLPDQADESMPSCKSVLTELVCIDMSFRWRKSSVASPQSSPQRLPAKPLLDDYVAQYPLLGELEALPPELLAHEFEVRNRWGDRPAHESYLGRFPAQYDSFCQAMQASSLAERARSPADDTRAYGPSDSATALSPDQETLPPGGTSPRQTTPLRQTASIAAQLPEQFGRYRILHLLGKGGMGAVYLAEDPHLERKVAIKVPFVGEDESQSVLDRFRREAQAIAALRHANICPIYDVSEVDGIPFMSMAYIEGETLADRLAKGWPKDLATSVHLVHKLGLALEDAHQRGVIHRDLKPANVLMDHHDEPMIMDFGLAKRQGKAETQLTTDGEILGTPSHMPPEQLSGKVQEMGAGCDIYSLGVVLYQMICGRLPFEGDLLSVLSQIANEAPVPPSQHRSDIEPRLDAICLKALEKSPADRYSSMAEFCEALQNYASESAPARSTAPTSRETRRWIPLATAPLVLAAVVIIWLAMRPPASGTHRPKKSRSQSPNTTDSNTTASSNIASSTTAESPELTWDVEVWTEQGDSARNGLSVRKEYEALPVQSGDGWQIKLDLKRPQFVYLIWADSAGVVTPIHPWRGFSWEDLPDTQQKITKIVFPEDTDPLDGKREVFQLDQAGAECLILLGRDEPLPDSFPWQQRIGQLTGMKLSEDARIFSFDRQQIRRGTERAPVAIKQVDDNLEQLHGRLVELFPAEEFPLLEGLSIRKH